MGSAQRPDAPLPVTPDELFAELAHYTGSVLAIAIAVFHLGGFGLGVELPLLAAGFAGLGLQSGGVLPR